LDFAQIWGIAWSQKDMEDGRGKIKLCGPFVVNLFKLGLCIGFFISAINIKDGSVAGAGWLIPVTCAVILLDMLYMEDERVDGRGGPLKLYENFDYLLIYAQMITLSVVFSNTGASFNWANVLIPTIIMMFLKC
jgi:hypothetical protein